MTGDNPSVTPSTFEFTIGYHILPVGRRGGSKQLFEYLKNYRISNHNTQLLF